MCACWVWGGLGGWREIGREEEETRNTPKHKFNFMSGAYCAPEIRIRYHTRSTIKSHVFKTTKTTNGRRKNLSVIYLLLSSSCFFFFRKERKEGNQHGPVWCIVGPRHTNVISIQRWFNEWNHRLGRDYYAFLGRFGFLNQHFCFCFLICQYVQITKCIMYITNRFL